MRRNKDQAETMCVLRVTGKHLDVEAILENSGLTPHKVFRAGEPRMASKPDGKRSEFSGCNVDVSSASWDSSRGQVDDAIAFLKEHRELLSKWRSTPGVEDMRLDFPLDLRIDRTTIVAQFDYFPPALISLAGALGLGLEVSIYPKDFEALARARQEA
jgi:hypothetical protein